MCRHRLRKGRIHSIAGRRLPVALLLTAAVVFAVAAAPPAAAQEDGLTLSDAWLRVIVPSRPAAGYFTLRNEGDMSRVLTGASSPACGGIMLHQSKTSEGVESMVMVSKVTVPAHGELRFAPRGYHLMCMKPLGDLKPGDKVPFTLDFADGKSLTGPFEVRGATAN